MCGICGKFNFEPEAFVAERSIRKMCAVIAHRGPDDEGVYVDKNVGLGNRRLATIDTSPAAHQPMPNEDKSIWITFNGEIYNHPKLRQELEKRGHRFQSHSDTEVILHLYEEYAASCVHQLRGMFAFAIWDSSNRRLFLARDRLGQKPLVYAVVNGSLIFASEIKSILQDPNAKREVDLEAVHHYLTYQYVPSPWTAFKGIKKLLPAHILICEKGKIRIERYWDLNYAQKAEMSEGECGERIIELLREATKIRLMSDVPLGAFLSGGIDSSSVVAMMSQLSSEPVSYLDMLVLEKNARLILTDSGGVQKEAYFFGLPCVTLREETERVETVEAGWNVLVGADEARIVEAVRGVQPIGKQPAIFGNGRASETIAKLLLCQSKHTP